jgi:ribose 5-phosphate isomerase A
MDANEEKRAAASAAAELVESGMRVGLGTGSTVALLLPELARRAVAATYVATSPRTEEAARALGIDVKSFDDVDALDLAIDGADQVDADGWLIKGGGAAQTREKIVAAAAQRFVVICDSSKLVDQLHAPVPLELQAFGLAATLRHLGPVTLRDVPLSPDGGIIADYHGDVGDPEELALWLSSVPGLVAHGLFGPEMVSQVLVGINGTVRSTNGGKQ